MLFINYASIPLHANITPTPLTLCFDRVTVLTIQRTRSPSSLSFPTPPFAIPPSRFLFAVAEHREHHIEGGCSIHIAKSTNHRKRLFTRPTIRREFIAFQKSSSLRKTPA